MCVKFHKSMFGGSGINIGFNILSTQRKHRKYYNVNL